MSERSGLVSAVIPAYNAAAYVREAIESVLEQNYSPIECILVDDGSTDRTAEIAQEFGDRVRVFRQANRDQSVTRNRGASEARGQVLAFLDADDRWLPERVERQMEVLETRGEIEAVICATEVVDPDLRHLGVIRQDPALRVDDVLLWRASMVSVSNNLLIRREAFEELGGFDERLSTSGDWALNLRLVQRGRLVSLQEPLVQYRLHGGNVSLHASTFARDQQRAVDLVLGDPTAAPGLKRLRRRAYANLHRVIAGSFFVEGEFLPFARHAARSVGLHPSTLPYFMGMPVRRLRRRLAGGEDSFTSPHAARRPPA